MSLTLPWKPLVCKASKIGHGVVTCFTIVGRCTTSASRQSLPYTVAFT